jgi:hypothetical protein
VKTWDLVAALYLSITLTVIAAVVLAWRDKDPHWLNRGGSFVSALAAISVYFQIRREVRLEMDRQHLEASARRKLEAAEHLTPLERAAQRLEGKQYESQREAITAERMRIGLAVAVSAFFGECLHGFGDLAVETFLRHLLR